MGDSAVILAFPYASDLSNEAKQGNPALALEDSISFGRFMSESLSWEKWSTFSHKKYVEEAERSSQPGSVAQKKAFFEAHYKRIAAQKAAALLEQENSADEQKIPEEEVDDHKEDVEKVELDKVESVKLDQTALVTEKEALMETPVKKILMNQVHNLENNDTVTGSEINDIPKVDTSLLKVIEIDKQNSIAEREKIPVTSKKRTALSSLKSYFHLKKSKVPSSEKSRSKSLIARLERVGDREQKLNAKFNTEEMPKEKTRRKFRKAHHIFCFKA